MKDKHVLVQLSFPRADEEAATLKILRGGIAVEDHFYRRRFGFDRREKINALSRQLAIEVFLGNLELKEDKQ